MHFTYEETVDRLTLQQGDVLQRTPALERVLTAVHPHYTKPDYRYFIVLTQTCDLIRRSNERCNSRYVTIAAVRPVATALERYVATLQYDEVEARVGVCSDDRREKLRQFIERLLNNNEDNFFFLREAPEQGLVSDHCAFLQLSIALKAAEHYQTLLAAKILQLVQPFQHKLGYLVGTSYARVGTEDWVPRYTVEQFSKVVREYVQSVKTVNWLDRDLHKAVLQRLKALPQEEQTVGTLERVVREVKQDAAARRREVIDTIGTIVADVGVDQGQVDTIKRRLENSPVFRAQVRKGAA